MHSPFWHTALPQTTTPLLAAQGHDLTDDWSLSCAHFVDSCMPISVLVWVRSFIEPDVLKTMYRSTIPLRFSLSDQSALEITVRIWIRLRVALF